MAVITFAQYHALVAAVLFTLATAAACLLAMAWPRARRPGQLPWRRWAWHVPRRHAAVLAVLRQDYRDRPGAGLAGREVERRSGSRCTRAVLARLTEAGWAERTRHPGITPYHMSQAGYRLTAAGWAASARVPGAHLPGEVEALQEQALAAGRAGFIPDFPPRGRHYAPGGLVLPPGHPSAPRPVIGGNGLTDVRPRD